MQIIGLEDVVAHLPVGAWAELRIVVQRTKDGLWVIPSPAEHVSVYVEDERLFVKNGHDAPRELGVITRE